MTANTESRNTHIPEWTLGDRLRKAREEAGMTQRDLADSIGIARNSVGNYEIGVTEPRQLVIREWARATGVPPEWLAFGRVAGGPKPPGLRYGFLRKPPTCPPIGRPSTLLRAA